MGACGRIGFRDAKFVEGGRRGKRREQDLEDGDGKMEVRVRDELNRRRIKHNK